MNDFVKFYHALQIKNKMSEKRLSSLQLPKIFNNRSIRIKSRDRSNKNKKSLTGRNFKTLSNDKYRKSTSQ